MDGTNFYTHAIDVWATASKVVFISHTLLVKSTLTIEVVSHSSAGSSENRTAFSTQRVLNMATHEQRATLTPALIRNSGYSEISRILGRGLQQTYLCFSISFLWRQAESRQDIILFRWNFSLLGFVGKFPPRKSLATNFPYTLVT